MTAWLTELKIEYVAMEATGVYWIPLFTMLVRAGIRAVLLNAADVKNYTARKTDVSDAQWLMTLMRYGMVKPSFQVDDVERKVHNLTRHRETLVSLTSDVIRRMQKCMELMNIKLTEVISDITGKSGIAIIEALLGGQRDPYGLARLADPRCSKSTEEIARALEGTWDEELLYMLGQHYEQYRMLRSQTKLIDEALKAAIEPIVERIYESREGEILNVIRSDKRPKRESNKLSFDLEFLATQIYGVNLMRIDGIQNITILTLLGELGAKFSDSFKSAAHFCSWANLSPNDKISGGKVLSSHIKKRSNKVGLALRNCAQTMAGSQTQLGDYYRRMRAKGGGKFAVCATAHKMATIIYTMVKNQQEYDASKVSLTDQKWLESRILKHEKIICRLKNKLQNVAE